MTPDDKLTTWLRRAFWPVLLAICAAMVFWRLQYVNGLGEDFDEGVYLMEGRLLNAGYPLYSETFSVTPPGFILLMSLAFKLLGTTAPAGRSVVLLFGAAGLICTALLGRREGGEPVGLLAAALLAVSPYYFYYEGVGMGEIPALTLASAALLLAWRYYDEGSRWPLFLAGLLIAASMLLKMLCLYAPVIVGGMVLLRRRGEGPAELGKDLAAWGLGLVAPVALMPLLFDWRAMYDQVIAVRWQARDAYPWQLSQNLSQLVEFAGSNSHYFALAAWGSLAALAEGYRREVRFALAWFSLALANTLVHTPLWLHHLVILLPPLTVLAGVGLKVAGGLLAARRFAPRQVAVLGGTALALGYYLSGLPQMVNLDVTVVPRPPEQHEQEAIRFMQEIAAPDEFILGDDPMLIFYAGRLLLPAASDTSLLTIKSGRYDLERLAALTGRYDVQTVVLWRERLAWVPGYRDWVEAHYLARRDFGSTHSIFYGRRLDSAASIERRSDVRLGDDVRLLGYKVNGDAPLKAGDLLSLTLYWQAESRVEEDYTVFVHLVGPDGQVWAQKDNPPVRGLYPTHLWAKGEIVTDRYDLLPGSDAPAGKYQLLVGMYRPQTLQRLPLSGPDGTPQGDAITLSTVTLERR